MTMYAGALTRGNATVKFTVTVTPSQDHLTNPVNQLRNYQVKLQPRHKEVIEFLIKRSPHKFTIDELAKQCNISAAVLRNEIKQLVEDGHILRHPVGRTYTYFADKAPSRYKPTHQPIEPLDNLTVLRYLDTIAQSDYDPPVVKLGWTLPKVLAELCAPDPDPHAAKLALENLLEALEGAALACRSLLATAHLTNRPWLTQGLPEKDLKIFEELSRQAIERYGRLTAAEQVTTTPPNQETQ